MTAEKDFAKADIILDLHNVAVQLRRNKEKGGRKENGKETDKDQYDESLWLEKQGRDFSVLKTNQGESNMTEMTNLT